MYVDEVGAERKVGGTVCRNIGRRVVFMVETSSCQKRSGWPRCSADVIRIKMPLSRTPVKANALVSDRMVLAKTHVDFSSEANGST